MGIKNVIKKAAVKGADTIAKLSVLSPEQLSKMQENREKYLSQAPEMDDDTAEELTRRLLAAGSIEIYNEYLDHIKDYYVPVKSDAEYEYAFKPSYNIRYFNVTKWVTDKKENSLEKLVNVYEVLADEECNIALVFHRTCQKTDVYLAVINTRNAENNVDVENYKNRLGSAVSGNFPGAEWMEGGKGIIPFMDNNLPYSVASASNVPGEKSEKFVSQTVEKLLDGMIPDAVEKEYTLILLATPVADVEERKLHLAELYSALFPYSGWQTNFTYTEADSTNSMATFGVNAGVSAGVQHGQNASVANTQGTTDSISETKTDSKSHGTSQGESNTEGSGESVTNTTSDSHADTEGSSDSLGAHGGVSTGIGPYAGASYNHTWNRSATDTHGTSTAKTVTKNIAKTINKMTTDSTTKSIANSLGRAVSNSITKTSGIFKSTSLGGNFGASFARASNVSATVGKNEGIVQNFSNYTIRHTLEILEEQMKRYEQSTALGMWDFAAYVMSEDQNIASNVAHTYLALTQGEQSYLSRTSVNVWRGDMGDDSGDAKEICAYLRELRHPVFGLNPDLLEMDEDFNAYPAIVTATTGLSGKELAYSLNFPQKSVSGLPVIKCAEFGRDVISYRTDTDAVTVRLGKIFHMNHEENTAVELDIQSLASHSFITGSTGSGKSNTIYQILDRARDEGVNFLVIEPAKGEYKNVFGNNKDVTVYGTNPLLSALLRINPFSFPKQIHILEHLDRLVEIFNVCWPMYAAMPAVLKSAVERSYTDCGWDLLTSHNQYSPDLYPDFSDVARNIKTIIESSEYDDENKGAYKGSLLTRLQSLCSGINGLIFASDEISSKVLFDQNVIVDLSRVGSSETKSLIMGMLVLKLQEHRMANSMAMNSRLKHITVLEEAHNLLRRTSVEQSTESANILGKSVEMLANAIAEMRTYGEGFIIADQAPGLMDMSVIRNTNTKIIMRLPDQGDRELVGKAANLDDDQISELAKLPCGVAAIYQNEWIQPVLCKVDYYDEDFSLYEFDASNSDDTIFRYKGLEDSLLKCIMDKELFRKGDKEDLRELKSLLIRSKLNARVKVDFIEYLNAEREEGLEKLRSLVYDFLNAEDAIKESAQHDDIHEWVNSVIEKLEPSVKNYSRKQMDLTMALILHEQMLRDASYKNLFIRFAEVYRNGGGRF